MDSVEISDRPYRLPSRVSGKICRVRGKNTYALRRGALLLRVDYTPTWLHRLGARLIGARFERLRRPGGRNDVLVV